jgi:hypothetical protein
VGRPPRQPASSTKLSSGPAIAGLGVWDLGSGYGVLGVWGMMRHSGTQLRISGEPTKRLSCEGDASEDRQTCPLDDKRGGDPFLKLCGRGGGSSAGVKG